MNSELSIGKKELYLVLRDGSCSGEASLESRLEVGQVEQGGKKQTQGRKEKEK